MSAKELAAATGQHHNTVRGHLEALAERGLVARTTELNGRRGRPAYRYEPVSPPREQLANQLITALAGQVRETTAALVRVAKRRGMACVIVGHVTKDGAIAGPRTMEHLVDVVLTFEGDRHSGFRMVRATKNRFGPADEVGCFEMAENGIVEVPDPSGLFTSHHTEPVTGTCVTVTMEGRRPMLAEIQALVAPSSQQAPRRTTNGAFKPDPVAREHQHLLMRVAQAAPSHFNSQPWRFVLIEDRATIEQIARISGESMTELIDAGIFFERYRRYFRRYYDDPYYDDGYAYSRYGADCWSGWGAGPCYDGYGYGYGNTGNGYYDEASGPGKVKKKRQFSLKK